jgi:hypothetical protein
MAMSSGRRMLVVTDSNGRIVAAAHTGKASSDGDEERSEIGVVPLPGQTIHVVEVPEEILHLTQGHHLHAALSHAHFDPESAKFVFPKIVSHKTEH